MSGLNMIQQYSSDSDDPDEQYNVPTKTISIMNKDKEKLPLPQAILSLKGVVHHEDVSDNPSEHNGRIRAFKHERGNWATLIYIDYDLKDEFQNWMEEIRRDVFETGNLVEEFHVSLTRTLIIKFHWIDSFVEAVKNVTVNHENFMLELSHIDVYCNEDKTRTFVGIAVQCTNGSLSKLTTSIDRVLDEFKLPLFYENPSYHISFLWSLGDQRKSFENLLPSLTSKLYNFFTEYPEHRYINVNSLKCKIGNKLYNFILS